MTISSLTLANILKNKLPFDQTKITSIIESINAFKYPLGVIPISALENNPLYDVAINDNINYLNDFTQYIFKNIYTQDEINIINVYLLLRNISQYVLSEEILAILIPLINIHSEKIEIEYCLDEIRYKYLIHLVYTNTNQNQINELMSYLSSIEEAHNSFRLDTALHNDIK